MAGPLTPQDDDRPSWHIMGERGWINDPNGPVFYQGVYHLFFQHLSTSCEWDWGLVWGHAISRDLVHWELLPPALRPTPGSLDADGCFSGCCTIDCNGVPTIMYTGVRLRSNPACGPLPPPECDLGLPFIESQLLAVADPSDATLQTWHKIGVPFIALPPSSEQLTGWRDPFVIQRGGGGREWVILMGAGIKGQGGTTLIYKATDLQGEWTYAGKLCTGDEVQGQMWECPLLALIPPVPARGGEGGAILGLDGPADQESDDGHVFSRPWDRPEGHGRERACGECLLDSAASCSPSDPTSFFYCISPDAPTNAVLYWMGHFDPATITYDLPNAVGPFRLDLGDTIYAPNILNDPHGRKVLWCWVQETRRKLGTYEYAGCMATPRIMLRRGDKLVLQPLPELAEIRRHDTCETWRQVALPEWTRVPLTGVSGRSIDMELTFRRGNALITGLVLHSWNVGGEGSAAVLFDWDSQQLEVMFEALDPETLQFSLSAPNLTRIGGKVDHVHGDVLHLRVLLDHSMLEIFTGNGQALTTRVYRGVAPPAEGGGDDLGIDFLSLGGDALLERMSAWEMQSIWDRGQPPPPPMRKTAEAAELAGLEGIVGRLDALALATATPQEAGILAV